MKIELETRFVCERCGDKSLPVPVEYVAIPGTIYMSSRAQEPPPVSDERGFRWTRVLEQPSGVKKEPCVVAGGIMLFVSPGASQRDYFVCWSCTGKLLNPLNL